MKTLISGIALLALAVFTLIIAVALLMPVS
jgi:hypothetical protein